MERFYVVAFRTADFSAREPREGGGGIAFLPEPRPENWQTLVAGLVRARFRHPLAFSVEVGYATLDRSLLERHCQRHQDLFWQGGDA